MGRREKEGGGDKENEGRKIKEDRGGDGRERERIRRLSGLLALPWVLYHVQWWISLSPLAVQSGRLRNLAELGHGPSGP